MKKSLIKICLLFSGLVVFLFVFLNLNKPINNTHNFLMQLSDNKEDSYIPNNKIMFSLNQNTQAKNNDSNEMLPESKLGPKSWSKFIIRQISMHLFIQTIRFRCIPIERYLNSFFIVSL
jgi:hypothetical protein